MTASLISTSASVISAVVSSCTAVLAFLVFREARHIRQLEWINTTNSVWNDFNRMILEGENHKQWIEFLQEDGNSEYEAFKFTYRINWILYTYLNVLVSSTHAMQLKPSRIVFFREILAAEFRILWHRRAYVSEFMDTCGYDPMLKSYFRNYCSYVEHYVQEGCDLNSAFAMARESNWHLEPART